MNCDRLLAHDAAERAVEIHSTWGTFEWLLHDAFDLGYRVGVVCHSDDHKGRPRATQPGASTFGAIGGLSCYLMPSLDRDAVFATLRKRRHYGTTGTRLHMSMTGTFEKPVSCYDDDPGAAAATQMTEVTMGAIVAANGVPMQLKVDVIGSAPLDRVEIFHGKVLAATYRPYEAKDLGRRVRVMWSGAEYRGRGREVFWNGKAALHDNRIERVVAVNFFNPDKPIHHSLHRAQRLRRDQSHRRGLDRLARRRHPSRDARRGDRHDTADRS